MASPYVVCSIHIYTPTYGVVFKMFNNLSTQNTVEDTVPTGIHIRVTLREHQLAHQPGTR